MKDWHRKPPSKIRSIEDALRDAERQRVDLPQVVQVYAGDWDKVILADEVLRLRKKVRGIKETRVTCFNWMANQ